MMKRIALFALLTALAWGDSKDHPTGPRITPPTISAISPRGLSRGMTVEMMVEGFNLAKASAIYFSEPGLKGKVLQVKELPDLPDVRLGSNGGLSTIDLGPLPPRNQVTVEVEVSPSAAIGPVIFRLLTPLGTSPMGTVLVEPFYGEAEDKEPNDTAENAVETFLPAILSGAISRPGDVDLYKIQVKAGDQLVFDNGGSLIGSSLTPVVAVLDSDQKVLREFAGEGRFGSTAFSYKFEKAGSYYVRVADYQESGKATHVYRIKVGKFPAALTTYPLGVPQGQTRTVVLKGYNLGTDTVEVKGEGDDENTLTIRPKATGGLSFTEVKLAVGRDPEMEAKPASAGVQSVTAPITINGALSQKEQLFQINAKKGQKLVLEVMARRLGSDLDSVLEVLDAQRKPLARMLVRPVWETTTTLSERDSASRGVRLLAWNSLAVGDYLMIGGEILRLEVMPHGPDEDTFFESFMGQRITFFDTTPESLAIDKPVYKVQFHPPGTKFAPNGLPLTTIYYRNDDGGPGYGKDSLLHFTAPADGTYYVKLSDVRGLSGEDFTYRLSIRPPRQDFRLSVGNRNPNVPAGGSIPLTVTAQRLDEFDGPIEVSLADLPAGLHATKGVIAPGQVTTTLLLSAEPNAQFAEAVPLRIRGQAGALEHWANASDHLKLIAVMPRADVTMAAVTREVEIEAGGTATVKVKIARQNGFGGRVPVEVRNLPPTVSVSDVGLNGVLLNENETERSFTLSALPNAGALEQLIYVSGTVETRAGGQQNTFAAPEAIRLRVKPATTLARKSGD